MTPCALPVNQIGGSRQAQLGIFLVRSRSIDVVVSGVGQVVGVADFLQPRIFHTAAFFVGRLGHHHRFGAAREMNTVIAGGIAQGRCALAILRAVEHYELTIFFHHGRIERSRGLEAIALRGQDGVGRKPRPLSKRRRKRGGSHSRQA